MKCNICGGEMPDGLNVCKFCGNVMSIVTTEAEKVPVQTEQATIDVPLQNNRNTPTDAYLYQKTRRKIDFCTKCGRPLDGITHKCIVCDAPQVSQRAYTNEDYKNREIEIMAQKKKKKKKKNTFLKFFLAVLGTIVLFSAAVYGAIKLSAVLGIGGETNQTVSETTATRVPKNTADPNWKADVKKTPKPTEEPTATPMRTPEPVETGDPVSIRGGKYLYPSDTHIISEDELRELTREEIKRIYWEIYARYGYTFNDNLADYFENNHAWYMPVTSDKEGVEKKFNSIEKRNIKVIEEYQKRMGWRQ